MVKPAVLFTIYLVTPFEDVSLPVSESLVQVNKLYNSMFAHVIRQLLRLFPAQRTSFRKQTHPRLRRVRPDS